MLHISRESLRRACLWIRLANSSRMFRRSDHRSRKSGPNGAPCTRRVRRLTLARSRRPKVMKYACDLLAQRRSNSTPPQWDCRWVGDVAFHLDANGGFDVKLLRASPSALRRGVLNQTLLSPLVWAFALLNTRNIAAPVHELSRAARRRIEKGHDEAAPARSFRILTVSTSSGMRSIDDTSGERLTKLHLVRGHWVRYTKEKPLFGRFTGTFWRSHHLRGDAERGAVVKAYRVEGPGDEHDEPGDQA